MQRLDGAALERLSAEGHVRLFIVEGVPIWEPGPSPGHQIVVQKIERSVARAHEDEGGTCACFTMLNTDLLLRPRGLVSSLVHPDIAVYCTEPPATDRALTLIPSVVIEVISPGFDLKDLEILPPAYLRAGVPDVIAFDPDTRMIHHFRSTRPWTLRAPATLIFRRGCSIMFPD